MSNDTSQLNAFHTLHHVGITLAADGARYHEISDFSPTDATTNPSLVYAAFTDTKYEHHLKEALDYAVSHGSDYPSGGEVEVTMDVLLLRFALQILERIPGRVSVSIDPRLFLPITSTPTDKTIFNRVLARCIAFNSLARRILPTIANIPYSSRLLFKIPATPLGIAVASTLESQHSIHTNLTLIFSPIQAIACAQAGVSVISPFVGRVKDFYESRGFVMPKELDGSPDMVHHPGIQLVRRIKAAFIEEGYVGKPEIMACGFRSVQELVELCRMGSLAGADLITVQPELLAELKDQPPFSNPLAIAANIPLEPRVSHSYFTSNGPSAASLKLFEADLESEQIAPVKVSEGLSKFASDTDRLEAAVVLALEARKRILVSSSVSKNQVQSSSSWAPLTGLWKGLFGYKV